MLKGIDVSYWKRDIDLGNVQADFVVAKATGGSGFVDPSCDAVIQSAIRLGKKWGVYHYAGDGAPAVSPEQEADFFVDNCAGYIGHGILILDWERTGNPYFGNPAWAKAWLDRVYSRTGVKPLIYMSLSIAAQYGWQDVINAGYGLWVAAYVDNNTVILNYDMDPRRDPNPQWDGIVNDVLWQFTSTGRLDGYGGNLDCNFFYGTREAWDEYAKIRNVPDAPPAQTTTTTTAPAPLPPEPVTTTTTAAAPVEPEPTTTTTTTTNSPSDTPTPPEVPGTSTSTTTTTTTQVPSPPQSVWLALWLAIIAFIKQFKGEKDGR